MCGRENFFDKRAWMARRAMRMGGEFGRHGRDFWSGGRERFFFDGELRLVILKLIAEKPRYGYELIKAIEELFAGEYSPSPGVIYPTLSLLEDEGFAVSSNESGKKLYTVTEAGTAYLKENEKVVAEVWQRVEQAGAAFNRTRSPQIKRAMINLMMAFKMRTRSSSLTQEQIQKIVEALDAAARTIETA